MEWISVKERLPKTPKHYWAWDIKEATDTGNCTPWVVYFEPDRKEFISLAFEGHYNKPIMLSDYSITHWAEMTLPEPPKGE